MSPSGTTVVIPNWNGARWLPGCLDSIARQELSPDDVVVVDNGSEDGSLEILSADYPWVRVVPLGRNSGFAHAANRGIEAAGTEFVALVNTDVVLAPDWLLRMHQAITAELPDAAIGSVACKMLGLEDHAEVYDAGDVLRRDGVCEQRGRFGRDDGSFDQPGDVFGACAGAALYRREAVTGVDGFDERYFAYLEDVDLALRLRLAGWSCRYEPVVALHAGGGSSHRLSAGHLYFVQRNALMLVAKFFPARWLPLVAYRQAAWAWRAVRERRLLIHLRATAAAAPLVWVALGQRQALRHDRVVAIGEAIPPRPFRGPNAGGHPDRIAASWRRRERDG